MKLIYEEYDSLFESKPDGPRSFEIFLDDKSEHYCQHILAESEYVSEGTFRGNVSIGMQNSVITLSIRHMYFKPIFEALLAGALEIRYHGYKVIPDTENLKLTDHKLSGGGSKIFNEVKFEAKFDFQV